ncbi:bacillolysin [Bacillus amyloliquefaciens]|nr:bacillolysin [Bacillus amyloliquefaciens]
MKILSQIQYDKIYISNYKNLPNTDDYAACIQTAESRTKPLTIRLQKSASGADLLSCSDVYLTSTFKDAKAALIQSARDLYGSQDAASVEAAWNAVGL